MSPLLVLKIEMVWGNLVGLVGTRSASKYREELQVRKHLDITQA